MIFPKDSLWTRPLRLEEGKKPLILVTYNESIFSAKNEKRKLWKEEKNHFYDQKEKRKKS